MTDQILWRLRDIIQPGRTTPRLDRVTVDIPAGITAILGASGSGKTSLLNLLVGFEKPVSGTIEKVPPVIDRGLRPDVFWSPADHGLWPHLTVRGHLHAVWPATTPAAFGVDELLKRFDLIGVADAHPTTLSMGERDRLAVARTIASDANIIVLDEPLVHVDSRRRELGWQALRNFVKEHSVVFATQQPEVALRHADWLIVLNEGRVLASGLPAALYDSPPDQTVAVLTGPMTWIPAHEASVWTERHVTGCVRPEQLSVEAATNSSLTVVDHRTAGVFDAIVLSPGDSRSEHRTFLTTPARQRFAPGTTVLLRFISMVLLSVMLLGCRDSAESNLAPVAEKTWSLPADGSKVPAPRGVTVAPNGEIYVLDNIGRVLVMDRDGVTKKSWWMPEYSVGKPERLLVCRDGRLAVADTHYHRVVIFNTNGEVLSMFGQRGSGPGEFEYPVAIAEDDRDNLYVCEYGGNDRVQVFRPDGTYVSTFGSFGTGPGQFQRPSGIVWRDGRLYIVDAFNNRVHVCDESGVAVPLPPGAFSADLHYPYDVSLTENGIVYVVEYGAGRVTWFTKDGELLGRSGGTGPGANQLYTPWGLSVDGEHAVFIADTGNRRLVNWVLKK